MSCFGKSIDVKNIDCVKCKIWNSCIRYKHGKDVKTITEVRRKIMEAKLSKGFIRKHKTMGYVTSK